MKRGALFILLVILYAVSALSDEPMIQVVDGAVPIIIDGNWIYPPFTLVLTDSTITVNGYQYEKKKIKKEVWTEPPDKEKNFYDWLVRTSLERGWAVVDSGGTFEEAKKAMEAVIYPHADGDTLKVRYGNGGFELRYYKNQFPLFISVPEMPREVPVPYRKGVLEPRFRHLLSFIEHNYLVVKGDNYRRGFPPRVQALVLPELERIAALDSMAPDLNVAPIVLEGHSQMVRLPKSLILDLMNPKSK